MNRQILLSVALVTRNRPGSLQTALASLRSQNVQPFEAVVSDDPDEEFVSEGCVSRAQIWLALERWSF